MLYPQCGTVIGGGRGVLYPQCGTVIGGGRGVLYPQCGTVIGDGRVCAVSPVWHCNRGREGVCCIPSVAL